MKKLIDIDLSLERKVKVNFLSEYFARLEVQGFAKKYYLDLVGVSQEIATELAFKLDSYLSFYNEKSQLELSATEEFGLIKQFFMEESTEFDLVFDEDLIKLTKKVEMATQNNELDVFSSYTLGSLDSMPLKAIDPISLYQRGLRLSIDSVFSVIAGRQGVVSQADLYVYGYMGFRSDNSVQILAEGRMDKGLDTLHESVIATNVGMERQKYIGINSNTWLTSHSAAHLLDIDLLNLGQLDTYSLFNIEHNFYKTRFNIISEVETQQSQNEFNTNVTMENYRLNRMLNLDSLSLTQMDSRALGDIDFEKLT